MWQQANNTEAETVAAYTISIRVHIFKSHL